MASLLRTTPDKLCFLTPRIRCRSRVSAAPEGTVVNFELWTTFWKCDEYVGVWLFDAMYFLFGRMRILQILHSVDVMGSGVCVRACVCVCVCVLLCRIFDTAVHLGE